MAEDPIPSAEPEISAPPPSAPPSPARPDPGVIDGEATEIRDETTFPAEAPMPDDPPPGPNRPSVYAMPAAIGFGGALVGAALALLAAPARSTTPARGSPQSRNLQRASPQ